MVNNLFGGLKSLEFWGQRCIIQTGFQ